jgi:hypothetical protein
MNDERCLMVLMTPMVRWIQMRKRRVMLKKMPGGIVSTEHVWSLTHSICRHRHIHELAKTKDKKSDKGEQPRKSKINI